MIGVRFCVWRPFAAAELGRARSLGACAAGCSPARGVRGAVPVDPGDVHGRTHGRAHSGSDSREEGGGGGAAGSARFHHGCVCEGGLPLRSRVCKRVPDAWCCRRGARLRRSCIWVCREVSAVAAVAAAVAPHSCCVSCNDNACRCGERQVSHLTRAGRVTRFWCYTPGCCSEYRSGNHGEIRCIHARTCTHTHTHTHTHMQGLATRERRSPMCPRNPP